MTYLNDVPDGGTHFKYQDLTTPAEKGLTILIWPTDFSHTHKGQITLTKANMKIYNNRMARICLILHFLGV